MSDPQGAPDVELYMERVRIICSGVAGEQFLPLVEQAQKLTCDGDATTLEPARELFRRAFGLFLKGYALFLEDPEAYESLVTWKEENTLPWGKDGTATNEGQGRPGVHEALFEGYEDSLSDYLFCLGQLEDEYRQEGRLSEAVDCKARAEEMRLFARKMNPYEK